MADFSGTINSDILNASDTDDRIYAYGGNDTLRGRLGNDLLDGMTGADTMYGGAGNDRYRVDNPGDVISEDEDNNGDDGGIELVESSVSYDLGRWLENLTLTGAAAIDASGNELNNKIKGNDAANMLTGGGGLDILTGFGGSDTFVFGPADATSMVTVTDFSADDQLGISAVHYGLREGFGLTQGQLSSDYFVVGTEAITSGHGQFVHDSSTRMLMWDADGAGGASGIAIAKFSTAVTLSSQDFEILGSPSPPPDPPPPDPTPQPVDPTVVRVHSTISIGSTDPSGLAYHPRWGLFLSDSEVEETPFGRANNLFLLETDGTLQERYDLRSFTDEATGLAFNSTNNRLYITDDDNFSVYWVTPEDPTRKLGEFATKPVGATDPEDIAVNPNNGNLFIANGTPHNIVETTADGKFVSTTLLPDIIKDPEALAYDATHDLFFVGGGFSSTIWMVGRAGNIVDTIDLSGYRNEVSGTKVHVKDLEFAPSTTDPDKMNLYVADYGNSHVDDGRLLEINLGTDWLLA